MTNRTCKIGKKARAARRIAAIIMTGTMAGVMGLGAPGIIEVSAAGYSENADYIFEYLTKRLGYNEAAACGIMANIRCESTFNPHAWNAGGGSYGLCQWTGGRYGRLQSWCRSNGYDYTTIDGQLAYLDYELKNYYGSVESHLRSVENTSDGAYSAGQYYCYHFEAPASRGSVSVYRGNLASGTFWGMYRPAELYEEDGRWRYIKNDGSYHIGWLTIDNKTFYLNQDGNRISGWKTIDGVKYYFDKDGVLASGWVKIDGKNYYFDEQGALITGMVRDGEDWYLLSESGDIKAASEMMEFSEVWIAAAKEAEQTALASAEEGTESSTSVDPSAAGTSNTDNSASETESKEDAQEETLASSGTTENASAGFDGIDGIQAVALAEAGKPADTNHLIPGSDQSAASGVQGSEETAATAAEEKNDDSETEEAVQTASENVQEEAETAESTDNAAAAADHTGEKAAEADTSVDAEKTEEADTSAVAEDSEEADTSAAAEKKEKAEEADTSASAVKSEEADKSVTSEESEAADTGVDGSEKAQKGDTADAMAAADKNAGTADKADDAASEQAQDSSEGASAEQTGKNSTEEAAAEQKQDSTDKAAAEQTGESSAEAVSEDMTAAKVFSEEKISEQATENGSTGSTSEKSDEAAAAEALSAAANALNEEDGDEIPAGDSFIIYEPPTLNEDSSSGQTGTSRKESSVKITLDYVVPFFDLKDLDNLADILRENDILHAVTKDGVDVTKDVKVTYERIDERSNAYKVIFSVDYKGETTEFETVFYSR